MVTVGIVANGPKEFLPHLNDYDDQIDVWIGADKGALTLMQTGLKVDWALGDFDSINNEETVFIQQNAKQFQQYSSEKDATDLELALEQAISLNADTVYLFGVTGGRFDHTLVNVQTLYKLKKQNIKGIIIDYVNHIELMMPGKHTVFNDRTYPYISFVPLTLVVKGLTLKGFFYPLNDETIELGSTLCVSNKLLANKGTFLYEEGILLLIKSRDSYENPIPL